MYGLTHVFISLALFKLTGFFSMTNYIIIFIMVFFTLLPDIDMPYSGIGKIFFPISRILYRKFGHRNITHSVFFMTLSLTPVMIFSDYFFPALIAYSSHLIADSLTYTGIPWLWPYHKNFNFLGGPIITGSLTETCLGLVAILVFTILEFFPFLIPW